MRKKTKIKTGVFITVAMSCLVLALVGVGCMLVWYSTDTNKVADAAEKFSVKITTERSELENLKSRLAESTSQEFIMKQVKYFNLGLHSPARGQVTQVSASMIANSKFRPESTIVAYSE